MPLAFLIFLIPTRCFAFLDFIGEQAKQATEAAAYADSIAELSSEISPNTELKTGAENIRTRANRLRSESSNIEYLSRSSQSAISGPDWSSKRLETNIRSTTEYVRRLKTLIARIAALGTAGATALNTTETNVALNEVQKNQQAMILQNEDRKLRELEKEQEESKSWNEFSTQQRRRRFKGAQSGKLQ